MSFEEMLWIICIGVFGAITGFDRLLWKYVLQWALLAFCIGIVVLGFYLMYNETFWGGLACIAIGVYRTYVFIKIMISVADDRYF